MTRGPVLGVTGGRGGVGASQFAAALAARAGPQSILVDLDPARGGIDVLLGVEAVPGARWSGLRLAGGHLDPAELAAGLPRWGEVGVLAADDEPSSPQAVEQLIDVAAGLGSVVVDLPRARGPVRAAAVARCALVILVVTADVGGVTGARSVAAGIDAPLGVVVRGRRRSARGVADLIGARLLGQLPPQSRERPLRRVRPIGDGVLDAVLELDGGRR